MEKGKEFGIDVSGYGEAKTDIAIDRKMSGGQTIKQFNRMVKKTNDQKKQNSILILKGK